MKASNTNAGVRQRPVKHLGPMKNTPIQILCHSVTGRAVDFGAN